MILNNFPWLLINQQTLLNTAQLLLCIDGVNAELEVTEEFCIIYKPVI